MPIFQTFRIGDNKKREYFGPIEFQNILLKYDNVTTLHFLYARYDYLFTYIRKYRKQ